MCKNILLKKWSAPVRTFKFSVWLFSLLMLPLLNAADTFGQQEIFLDGEWITFVQVNGEVIFKPSISYIFHKNESWSIKENEQIKKQGAIKYGSGKVYLYVESKDDRKEAVPVKILNENNLEITNLYENKIKLLLIEKNSVPRMDAAAVCGSWSISHKDFTSGKISKSQYILHIKNDHFYEIESPEKNITNTSWYRGSWIIKDDILYLKNDFNEKHFWNDPAFFFYGSKLMYNNNSVCIWAEKINSETK